MLLDLVLPQRCVVCGVGGVQLCDGCLAALPRIRPPLCARCGTPTVWPVGRCAECAGRRISFASARSAVAHDAAARRLVGAWKDRGLRRLAVRAAAVVAESTARPEGVVTFVPPDRERRLRRGHHPAETLAAALALRWELPVAPLLERRGRRPQRGLSRAERRANVRHAFIAAAAAPPRVVLVDDVYTSGATANAAAAALRRAGAKRVEVVTFTRVVRRIQ